MDGEDRLTMTGMMTVTTKVGTKETVASSMACSEVGNRIGDHGYGCGRDGDHNQGHSRRPEGSISASTLESRQCGRALHDGHGLTCANKTTRTRRSDSRNHHSSHLNSSYTDMILGFALAWLQSDSNIGPRLEAERVCLSWNDCDRSRYCRCSHNWSHVHYYHDCCCDDDGWRTRRKKRAGPAGNGVDGHMGRWGCIRWECTCERARYRFYQVSSWM